MRNIILTEFELLMKKNILGSSSFTYLDENRLKQSISFHLPNLRIFDIMIFYAFQFHEDANEYLSMIE
jgi:hypothetical protein